MTVWCNNQLCTIYFNIDTVVWLMVHNCLHYRPKLVNPNPTVCISEHTACISEHYGIFKNKCSFTLNNTELNVAYHSLINNTMKHYKTHCIHGWQCTFNELKQTSTNTYTSVRVKSLNASYMYFLQLLWTLLTNTLIKQNLLNIIEANIMGRGTACCHYCKLWFVRIPKMVHHRGTLKTNHLISLHA